MTNAYEFDTPVTVTCREDTTVVGPELADPSGVLVAIRGHSARDPTDVIARDRAVQYGPADARMLRMVELSQRMAERAGGPHAGARAGGVSPAAGRPV